MADHDVPVLIAGGSLPGVSAALFLAQHGVGALAIEQHRGDAVHTTDAQMTQRTMEIFREVGLEEILRLKAGEPFVHDADAMGDISPCKRLSIARALLASVLKKRADELDARVRAGAELVGFEQDSTGVSAALRERDSGRVETVRAAYMVIVGRAHGELQAGRVFFVRDTADVMPDGGDGDNAGVQDAHNLAWKVAMVLDGAADPELLSTYEAERRGHPASRAPHVWLNRGGERISTLDLFGRRFVLLGGPESSSWCAAARVVSDHRGLPLDIHRIGADGLTDPEGKVLDSYGITGRDVVVIRPDGIVGWRSKTPIGSPSAVAGALAQLTFRDLCLPERLSGVPWVAS